MPDSILNITDFDKIFQNAAIDALGMTEAALVWKTWLNNGRVGSEPLNPYYFVRIAYPPKGSPAWKQSEDVCFIKCVEVEDAYNKQRDISYQTNEDESLNKQTAYTRVFAISLTAYGPSSFSNVTKIKNYLFKSVCRDNLALSKIFLIPNITAIIRLPELFQGQWWERADLTVNFNNLVIENETINSVESVEIVTTALASDVSLEDIEITLVDDKGEKEVLDITLLSTPSGEFVLVNSDGEALTPN